jgi:hypothetical protein
MLSERKFLSLKYNQQEETFSRAIYFYKLLYTFQAVLPPIIRSTKLHTASSIVEPILLPAAIVDEVERSFHLIHDSSSIGLTILTLYVVLCS